MKAGPIAGLDPEAPLRPNMVLIVRARLDELLSFAEAACEPAAATAQHDMRIAAKRLRYVLEICESCFGPEAGTARKAAKRLQGALGELHDCDVMLPRLEAAEIFAERLRARREACFRSFLDCWGEEASRGTWVALERSLNA